jgi:hypothetical protein
MQSKHAYPSKQTPLEGGERERGRHLMRETRRESSNPKSPALRCNTTPTTANEEEKKNGKKSAIASERARGETKTKTERKTEGEKLGESWKERQGGAAITVAAAALQREWRSGGS